MIIPKNFKMLIKDVLVFTLKLFQMQKKKNLRSCMKKQGFWGMKASTFSANEHL